MKNPLRKTSEPEPLLEPYFPERAAYRTAPPPGSEDFYVQAGGGFGRHSLDAAEAQRVRHLEEAAEGRAEQRGRPSLDGWSPAGDYDHSGANYGASNLPE